MTKPRDISISTILDEQDIDTLKNTTLNLYAQYLATLTQLRKTSNHLAKTL